MKHILLLAALLLAPLPIRAYDFYEPQVKHVTIHEGKLCGPRIVTQWHKIGLQRTP